MQEKSLGSVKSSHETQINEPSTEKKTVKAQILSIEMAQELIAPVTRVEMLFLLLSQVVGSIETGFSTLFALRERINPDTKEEKIWQRYKHHPKALLPQSVYPTPTTVKPIPALVQIPISRSHSSRLMLPFL